eukprot:scaffold294129_cov33-Tisochrysis_lutea.AAC.4
MTLRFRVVALQNHNFMKKLKDATSSELKKKIISERSATLAAMGPDERKKNMMESRKSFQEMYKMYCAPGASATIPQYNPSVCTNPMIKQLYGPKPSTASP